MSGFDLKKIYSGSYQEQFEADWELRKIASEILSQAISDLLGGEDGYREYKTFKKNTAQKEAAAWIESDSVDWVFSFINLCAILDLHPDWIRKKISERKVFAVRRIINRRDVRRLKK